MSDFIYELLKGMTDAEAIQFQSYRNVTKALEDYILKGEKLIEEHHGQEFPLEQKKIDEFKAAIDVINSLAAAEMLAHAAMSPELMNKLANEEPALAHMVTQVVNSGPTA